MLFFVGLIIFASFGAISAEKNVMCVLHEISDSFSVEKDIDPQLCTHIIVSEIELGPDNQLKLVNHSDQFAGSLKKLVALKDVNPKLKILISMPEIYPAMTVNPKKWKNFVKNALQFLDLFQLDGFDLILPHFAQNRESDFVPFLKELKTVLSSKNKLLSIEAFYKDNLEISYIDYNEYYNDFNSTLENVDFLNIVNAPMNFEDKVALHFAPLYDPNSNLTNEDDRSIATSISDLIERNFDPKKINIAVFTFGFNWTLADPNKHDLYDPVELHSRQLMHYNKICELKTNWHTVFDETQKVPYKYSGKQWIAYENVQSLTLKSQFVKDKNLGGVVVFTLNYDDYTGHCGNGKYPLIKAIKKTLS